MKRYVIAFGAMILLLGGLLFFNIGSGSVRMTGSEIGRHSAAPLWQHGG